MLDVTQAEYPKLRRLEMRAIAQQGGQHILLSDPLQVTDQQLLIPEQLSLALAYCDGQRSVNEICTLFSCRSGILLQPSQLSEMLTILDNAYMLENARYRSMLVENKRVYRNAKYRQPSFAGRSYPADPAALRQHLDDYLVDVEQSDCLVTSPTLTPGSKPYQPMAFNRSISRGLLSPHIDYGRGGRIYAQVWKEAEAAAQAADLVIMFGTDHGGTDRFTLTKQSYATPYGILPTSTAIVDALARKIGEDDAYAGELRHRGEHSLELVAVWLHHMRQGKPYHFVPILVGGFHAYIQNKSNPQDDPRLNNVLETLCVEINQIKANGNNVLVVASGDLAHVGPAFGGAPLTDDSRQSLHATDSRLITHMQAGNAEQFFEEIRHIQDANNVCGTSPIYLTMKLLELVDGPICGELIGYETCPADDFDTSAVTIGGVVFN